MKSFIVLLLACAGCTLYFEGHGTPPTAPDSATVPGDDAPPDDPFGVRRVFVTSGMYQGGKLGGLDGADTICMNHATAAGLPGTYRAWLSDDTGSPSTRMTKSAGSYRLVNGVVVAHGWDDFTDGILLAAIDHDEHGDLHQVAGTCMGAMGTWTDTDFAGLKLPPPTSGPEVTCFNWSDLHGRGHLGRVLSSDRRWTDDGYGCAQYCTSLASIYCVQQ